MTSALGNLRVLDFSRVLAGPFATMMLADLGATVVKVERPGTGDDTRAWGPPHDARGDATYFQAVNRNKQSVVLDLADRDDQATARRLATEADVVVENFRPGVMDRLGLGYDDLATASPGLIYCSITGFGRGEGAALPGYDLLIQALGGLMSITGAPDGAPQKVGVAVVDVLAGLFAGVGILAALTHRRATGEGQRVDVDLLSSLLAALVNQGSAYTVAGSVAERMGNAHPSIAPYELLPARDGDLVLAVGNDRQFAALCEVLDHPELAGDARFATNGARVAHRAALSAALTAALAHRGAAEWAEALTGARVPAGVVNDIAGAFDLATRLGLEPIVEVPAEDGGMTPLTRNPIGLSATPPTYRSAPPRLAQSRTDPDRDAGYRRAMAHRPRRISFLARAGRLKHYGIAVDGPAPREALVTATRARAAEVVPENAYGFTIAHDAATAGLGLVYWWHDDNELHHRVFASPHATPGALEAADSTAMACVWELEVIDFERRAWLEEVLRGEEPARYLERTLPPVAL